MSELEMLRELCDGKATIAFGAQNASLQEIAEKALMGYGVLNAGNTSAPVQVSVERHPWTVTSEEGFNANIPPAASSVFVKFMKEN